MKTRAELKGEVKQLFKGRWKDAVLLCIVVSLLSIFTITSQYSDQYQRSSGGTDTGTLTEILHFTGMEIGLIVVVVAVALLVQIAFGLIIKIFKVGTSYSMLDWVRNPDREIHAVKDSTVGFTKAYAGPIIGLAILQGVFVFLWALLLIVPGIIKAYAYSQSFYVYKDMLAATPTGQARPRFRDALTRSRQLMVGHKWQLFCLQLSFIGWGILSGLTLGIGQLWLIPYTYGTFANYYDNLVQNNAQ
ncbi:DUF975 family protein [Lactiplantibacillus garii]|uniref:DUF975 family protein n=1 Tax=Lactiplantibacillus garii TaxID=2306423 RepID=A0A426D8A3_9LACO|nr:DUF975 family protein [Lactiplantibacillus garii]RRK10849.1 DUF975 family protein [Lactiplantibacillus garii]